MMAHKIADDFFMFQGGIGLKQMPPSYCNTYLLRDENTLILYDSSVFKDLRNEMLKTIKEYEGVCNVFYLINGHSDLDHVGNNDIIDDVKIEQKHFIIHEGGLPRLSQAKRFRAIPRSMHGIAEPLRDREKEKITIGNMCLQGWRLGNIYLIHDGAHVKEHLCLYDAKRRALLVGDLTGEYNPMLNSKTNRLIEYCDIFTKMAEEGYVEILGDGHRSRDAYEQAFQKYDIVPFTQLQMSNYIQGKDAIIEFLRGFSNYYRELRDTILDVHKDLGSATIKDILGQLRKSDSQAIQMKLKLEYPRFLSWIRYSVTSILVEAGSRRRKIGTQTFYETKTGNNKVET